VIIRIFRPTIYAGKESEFESSLRNRAIPLPARAPHGVSQAGPEASKVRPFNAHVINCASTDRDNTWYTLAQRCSSTDATSRRPGLSAAPSIPRSAN
jgi:hypothetical protein